MSGAAQLRKGSPQEAGMLPERVERARALVSYYGISGRLPARYPAPNVLLNPAEGRDIHVCFPRAGGGMLRARRSRSAGAVL